MKRITKRVVAFVCMLAVIMVAVPLVPSPSAVEAATTSTTVFYEGFESCTGLPAGWTAYDVDGDGHGWTLDSNGYNGYPSDGNCLYSTSALSWSQYLRPDDWFTLPAITLPSANEAAVELSFQIMTSYMTGYSDYIQVYASTTPITDVTALTAEQMILDETYYTGYSYQEMTASLDAFRGQTVYLAFRHHTAYGVWQMYLDDVTVSAKLPKTYRVEFPDVTDVYTVTPANGTYYATADTEYSFRVDVADEYLPDCGTLTVFANGDELIAEEGLYTIPCVTEKQTVDIVFAYDDGDVCADGSIDILDVLALYNGVAGSAALTPPQMLAGKIDYREAVDILDVMALYSYVSGTRAYIAENQNADLIWKSEYAYGAIGSTADLVSADYYFDTNKLKDFSAPASAGDAKYIFYGDAQSRVVNVPDGYAITLPLTAFDVDYTLGEHRSHYETEDFVLNISYENQNPYGNTASSWNTYLTEWLNRFIANDSFLSRNNISRVRAAATSTTKLSGYTVLNYDLCINDSDAITMPYYHIAVIRKNTEYVKFYLLVMKSTTDQTSMMDSIVKSFKEVTATGRATNKEEAFECDVPEYWSDETKAYYEKLMSQSATDWGFFSASMVDSGDSSYNTAASRIQSEYDRLSTALDYEYEIMPTYTHIGWGSNLHDFPIEQATRFAGGNGFNGKPVLQFTYQFTTSNNTNLEGYTPMFDVLRGDYDDHFRNLARDIKAYSKPVLFRLNNEMNTDWTSYAGIVTLLDPDIFVMTWERMYEIFLEEGVDNCIWIFNPIATTTPYCDWGEYLCYMPDADYVQALGLTAYENANGTSLSSFETLYRNLYEKNTPYFDEYPWIISEFAVGAGGERVYDWASASWKSTVLGRNAAKQAAWVEAMFECFAHRDEKGYEFVKNIKGAVWFSCNDYTTIGGTDYVTNYLKLENSLTATLAALKKGLANEQ